MECNKCHKELTIADVPDYTTLEELKKDRDPDVYLLCAVCRKSLEEKHKDIDFNKLKERMDILIPEGAIVFVKFTCHNCGARQTEDKPNAFFTKGYRCEECGKVSYPNKFGFITGFVI